MSWNPAQYERFREQRDQPFFDLLGLVQKRPDMRVVDLGCGTGELTRELFRRLGARTTLGIDSSPTMLERARPLAYDGLSFGMADIDTFEWRESYDLVFSNAALQWVPDNAGLLTRLTKALTPGGQLAVQVPANDDHPAYALAAAVAGEEPFLTAQGGFRRESHTLAPERYATLLDRLGYTSQHVRLQVYPHHLASREDMIEWVKGTLLLAYQKQMPADLFPQFVARFRERLFQQVPDTHPVFFPFKRILFWAQRPVVSQSTP
jgi:trans-aconitate 2-methyltransferase